MNRVQEPKYQFNVPEERPVFTYTEGLVPMALAEAEQVRPCEEIQQAWETQIFQDIENNRPSSWRRFINRYTP